MTQFNYFMDKKKSIYVFNFELTTDINVNLFKIISK